MADDDALFMAEMAGVTPFAQDKVVALGGNEKLSEQRQKRETVLQMTLEEELFPLKNIPMLQPQDYVEYKRNGVQEGVFRKLRLGHYALQARVELQGLGLRQARSALHKFINDCLKYELRTVLVTHGLGLKADPPAQLKSHVSYWMMRHPRVMACHSAQKQHGGSGALYLLLEKSANQKLQTRERHARRMG